jgi:uncharacterized protein YecE (DUF72 family)
MRLFTGTSGFSYKEWKGSFYPADLPASGMLAFYAARFPTVEINNTFYRMPTETQLRQWAEQVPAGFRFVLKAPQRITHHRRLKEVGEEWGYFSRTAAVLGAGLGPILVQLPPNMKCDVARLDDFLSIVAPEQRIALEFRHPSWLDDHVYDLLRRYRAALCVAHGELDETPPVLATASWGYARLRNVEYSGQELRAWAERLAAAAWDEVFVFFKHEDAGTGPRLAAEFEQLFPAGNPGPR